MEIRNVEQVSRPEYDLSELNERQKEAFEYVLENGMITNSTFQKITGAERKTVARDLKELVELGLLDVR